MNGCANLYTSVVAKHKQSIGTSDRTCCKVLSAPDRTRNLCMPRGCVGVVLLQPASMICIALVRMILISRQANSAANNTMHSTTSLVCVKHDLAIPMSPYLILTNLQRSPYFLSNNIARFWFVSILFIYFPTQFDCVSILRLPQCPGHRFVD